MIAVQGQLTKDNPVGAGNRPYLLLMVEGVGLSKKENHYGF